MATKINQDYLDALAHEAWLFTGRYGGEPTIAELSRWCGFGQCDGPYRVKRMLSAGLVEHVRDGRPRRFAKGPALFVLKLTTMGLEAAARSDGLPDAIRDKLDDVCVPTHAHVTTRVDAPSDEVRVRRLAIVRAVVAEMGTTRDEDRTLDTCPVLVEVRRRWRADDLGEGEWTLEECAAAFGLSRERIRQIESQAMQHIRHRLRAKAAHIREELREIDEARADHWSCEAAA